MKRFISLILIFTIVFSLPVALHAMSFTDMDESHWAAGYINTLVSDGTINGFEDGTFRPNATVTRAQIVKMIGKGETRKTIEFSDVTPAHWAYEYVMSSELDGVSADRFEPDMPVTRDDVVNLLWKRAGEPSGVTAPPVINRQGSNYEAASWAYTSGLVIGSDYMNLRLSDTLTRAEAATLIVRARGLDTQNNKISFIDAIDQTLFEKAFNSFALIDKTYNAEGTITNGELAMAAARIISDETSPTYQGVSATPTFAHPYAMPLNMLCRYYLGEEKDNAEYADAAATVRDAILALTFATLRTSLSYIPVDANGENYSEITSFENDNIKYLLAAAYQNGVRFGFNDTINPQTPITMKQFACLAIEFDGFSGLYTAKICEKNGAARGKDCKLNTSIGSYPYNESQYTVILADVPRYVYEVPFSAAVQTPKESFYVTNQFRAIFENMFSQLAADISKKGADVTFTIYPGLTVNNGKGYTSRVKMTINALSTASVLSDIIRCADDTIASYTLVDGASVFLDIDTGKVLDDVVFPVENVFVSKLIG